MHLWLGFTSGLVVFIIAVTGCIYAFQEEIQNMTQSYRFVEPQNKEVLPPSQLKAIAMKEVPDKHVHAVLYGGTGKAAHVYFYSLEPAYFYTVYLNPYTGEVLKVKDMDKDFFYIILMGHFYLWLPHEIGQPIAASATLIFVVMMITGLILWWPRKKGAVKQRFTIRWSARWRRKNYDLHNVLGFYVTWIAIIVAVTGLVWGFQWFAQGLYATAGGDKSLMYIEPPSDTTARVSENAPAIDRVWELMRKEYPTAKVIEVHVPETSASPIAANANPDDGTYWQTDYRYYDQYSLKELSVDHIYGRFETATAADKLIRMNYDIHVGAILGLPGKILAFCASLICASLPVTGVSIWWGRRKKKKEEEADNERREVRTVRAPVRRARAAEVK
jgi:uncharacterized iron-regulated membrane protein